MAGSIRVWYLLQAFIVLIVIFIIVMMILFNYLDFAQHLKLRLCYYDIFDIFFIFSIIWARVRCFKS